MVPPKLAVVGLAGGVGVARAVAVMRDAQITVAGTLASAGALAAEHGVDAQCTLHSKHAQGLLTKDGKLELSFSHTPLFKGELIHWEYDTFKIDWYDIRVPDGFLTFNFNSKREILGFSLDQKKLLDVDFNEIEIKRKAD